MVRTLLLAASITILAPGCASHARSAASPKTAHVARATPKRAVASKKTVPTAPADVAASAAEEAEAALPPEREDTPRPMARKLGDFHVYQYAGSFTKQPLTLTEQVVAREGDTLVVDFVLEEGSTMSALRVRMKPSGEAVSAARIGADGEVSAPLAEYDALVRKTQLVPDSNDEVVGSEHTACLVGEEQVDCDVTTYKVSFGGKHAKLTITRSSGVPGRDIGGDIVSDEGKVLYSARLVERGNEPPVVEAFAKLDRL